MPKGEQQQQGRQHQVKIESSASGGGGGSDRVPRVPRDQSTSAVAARPASSKVSSCSTEVRGGYSGAPANAVTGTKVCLPPLPPVVEFSAVYPYQGEDGKERSSGEKTPLRGSVSISAEGSPVMHDKNAAPLDYNSPILSTPALRAHSDEVYSAAMLPEPTVAVATEAVAKGGSSSNEEHALEHQLQQFVSQKLATGSLDEAGMCALDALAKLKKGSSSKEQQALENQLQQFVSKKLATGDLDKAGMCALDALAKMKMVQPAAHASTTAVTAKKASSREQKGHHSTPPGVGDVPKFSGKDPSVLKQTLNGFAQCVNIGLNRPGITTDQINTALLRDVHIVLEGPASEWFRLLMKGRVKWEPSPPPDADTDDVSTVPSPASQMEKVQPPTTWKDVCNALEDQFLPAEGISRTRAALLSIRQAPGESIRGYAGRQLGLNHHLNQLMERHGSGIVGWEVLQMGLFEKGLTPHLQRAQHAEPACNSFAECVARAEANDAILSATRAKAIEAAAADGGKDVCTVKTEPTAGNHRGESRTTSDDIVSKKELPTKSNSSTNKPVMASEEIVLPQGMEKASSRVPPSHDESNNREHESKPKSTHDAAPQPSKRKREESGTRGSRGARRSGNAARGQPRPQRRTRNDRHERLVPCEVDGCNYPHNHTTNQCFMHPQHGMNNRKQFNERRNKQKTEGSTREWGSPGKEKASANHHHEYQTDPTQNVWPWQGTGYEAPM